MRAEDITKIINEVEAPHLERMRLEYENTLKGVMEGVHRANDINIELRHALATATQINITLRDWIVEHILKETSIDTKNPRGISPVGGCNAASTPSGSNHPRPRPSSEGF